MGHCDGVCAQRRLGPRAWVVPAGFVEHPGALQGGGQQGNAGIHPGFPAPSCPFCHCWLSPLLHTSAWNQVWPLPAA